MTPPEVVKEVAGLAPYERRVLVENNSRSLLRTNHSDSIELLRNSKDKRAVRITRH